MAKRKTADVLILLLCSVPYAFLAMYADAGHGIAWMYLLSLCCPIVLSWYCGKRERITLAVLGNLISCGLSLLLAYRFLTEEAYYFKPFGIGGMAGFLSALSLAVQLLVWKRLRRDNEPPMVLDILEHLAALFVAATVLIFGLLIVSHLFLNM